MCPRRSPFGSTRSEVTAGRQALGQSSLTAFGQRQKRSLGRDTFNYATLDVNAWGQLSVEVWGIPYYPENVFPSDPTDPELILSFQLDIPEPAPWGVLAVGIAGLRVIRRRARLVPANGAIRGERAYPPSRPKIHPIVMMSGLGCWSNHLRI
jgi:hypothetical protein